MIESCQNCRFWTQIYMHNNKDRGKTIPSVNGNCRRYPTQHYAGYYKDHVISLIGQIPARHKDDWCGEWKEQTMISEILCLWCKKPYDHILASCGSGTTWSLFCCPHCHKLQATGNIIPKVVQDADDIKIFAWDDISNS